jgi:hypothetical protein
MRGSTIRVLFWKKTSHPPEKCFFRNKQPGDNTNGPNGGGGSSSSGLQNGNGSTVPPPAGGAIVAGTGVGNLLEQMLAAKLIGKIIPWIIPDLLELCGRE